MAFSIRIEVPRFDDFARGVRRDAAKAVTAAMKAAALGIKTDIRQEIAAGGLGERLPNAVGTQVYPPSGDSLGAAVLIYGKGERAQMLLDVFSRGVEIRAKNRKYLLVPTPEGRAAGLLTQMRLERRGGGETRLVKRRATDLDFARVSLGRGDRSVVTVVPPGKMHPRIGFVIARGVVAARSGRGFRPATARRLRQGRGVRDVVLALLLPQVTLKPRFDMFALLTRWSERIPGLIERAMPRE